MSHYYPLLCDPLLVPKVWGGRRLAELLDKQLPAAELIGESWEVADLAEGCSTVANGALAGRSLRQAVEAWGAGLVGTSAPDDRFPLLVKLLDANDDLSVQVHPSDDDCAESFPQHHGKDETWIVIDAAPSGRIIHGFLPGASVEEHDRRVAAGTIPLCLQTVNVRPGQVIRVAPGTVHALLTGVVVLEIQQPSDSTFRVYDYGRDATSRPLHHAESRAVLKFETTQPVLEPQPLGEGRELLVDVPAYRIERWQPRGSRVWRTDPRSAQVLTVLGGRAVLSANGTAVTVERGRTVILPAAMGEITLTPDGPTTVVVAGLGDVPIQG